jgi:RNA polymerase Rpb1 C-terminal repeat
MLTLVSVLVLSDESSIQPDVAGILSNEPAGALFRTCPCESTMYFPISHVMLILSCQYSPTSPAYSPTSPAYSPTSPQVGLRWLPTLYVRFYTISYISGLLVVFFSIHPPRQLTVQRHRSIRPRALLTAPHPPRYVRQARRANMIHKSKAGA